MKKLVLTSIALAALFAWIYLDRHQDTPFVCEDSHHLTIKDRLSVTCCGHYQAMQVCQDTTYCRPAASIRYCQLEDYRNCYIWPANTTKR